MISIDFGQPHARGRTVLGALAADIDTVWRLGANDPTTLRSDVDLMIGTITVPKGAYTLAAQTSAAGAWKLIVNGKTGQDAVPYDPIADGEIRFAWGTKEFSAPWRVK
jgi:hypothetical protein